MFQNTLKEPISITGVGAHSGQTATVLLMPASENHGIVFTRDDLQNCDTLIPALWSYVVDTRFCTKIANAQNASLATIEHVMAALYAKKIDNALIKIDGPEMPILDGSSKPFIEALDQAGIQPQKARRRYLKILKPISVSQGDAWAEIKPSEDFSIHYTFRNKETGVLEVYHTDNALESFAQELSPARTFGYLQDVEKLYNAGLAKGSSLKNAVVFDKGKVLNPEGLRFHNECARHKALDVVGDLYLSGMPLIGTFKGYCSGHSLNNMLLKTLLNDKSAWTIEAFTPKTPKPSLPSRERSSDPYQHDVRFGTY